MNAPDQQRLEAFGQKHRASLVTLLFTDMAGSTALKQKLGDHPAARLIAQHHALVRSTLQQLGEGEELNTAGDSFFLVFTTPSAAVHFALLLQRRLRELSRQAPAAVQDRIGLHLGEVLAHARGEKLDKDVTGLNVDICSRVMSLAQPGQILMTRPVFDNARQSLKGEEIEGISGLEWLNHGRFELKGVAEPVEVCEVRMAGSIVLQAPTSSEKARRVEAAEGEAVLGWRPAVGSAVPNTKWVLEEKLGEGGFGEVWLGRHQVMKERRVFKFCFRADRVRSLKREMTLFRLIKERIGDHPNIVALREVYFDQPPYYVEEEYVAGQDLANWCATQGGADKVPLETKLEIVAQIAEALQAAHDAGVIHRDVKPANILVGDPKSETGRSEPSALSPQPSAKLTDFGIGQVVSEEYLSGVTKAGFTQTMLGSESSSQTGTQLYMAPELLAGKPASTRSDIYSLGVVLFQLLAEDFSCPVTTDWARRISDPLLREDLEHCFAGNVDERFAGAGQLARNLRSAGPRRAERLQRERLERRVKQRHRLALAAGAGLLAVALIATALGYGLRAARRERDRARLEAYFADIKLADTALNENNVGQAMKLLQRQVPDAGKTDFRGIEWRVLWERCQGDQVETFQHDAEVSSAELSPDGRWLATESGGRFWLWDISQPGRPCQWLAGGAAGIGEHLVFDPRGRFLATAGETDVRIWDPVSWQRVRSLTNRYAALSISTNGTALAVVGQDGVQVWDTVNWQLLLEPGELAPQWNGNLNTALSADGSLIAVSSTAAPDLEGRSRSEVVVWRLSDRSVLLRETDLVEVTKLVFSDDGRWLAACAYGPPATLHLWSIPVRKRVARWPADDGLGKALAFAPGGGELVSAGSAQVISRWRTGSTNRLGLLKGHYSEVECLRFARDGRLVSGSKDGTVRIWKPGEVPPNRRSFTLPPGRIAAPLTSGRGKLTTFAPWEWVFEEWDLASGQLLAKKAIEQGEALLGGGRLATNSGKFHNYGFLDVSVLMEGGAGKVAWLCVGVPGWELFATTGDGWLHAWDAETGRLVFSRRVLTGPFLSVGLSPDRKRFWTGDLSGRLSIWSLQSTDPESTFTDLRGGTPYAFSVSSDGELTAFRTRANDVVVWDCNARTRRAVIPCAAWLGEYAVALSPDKRFIAVASNQRPAQIWELATGRPATGLLYGHLAGIEKLSFSPDSRLLVTYCEDLTAKAWSVKTGQEVLSGIRLNDLLYANPLWQLFLDQDTIIASAGNGAFRVVHLPSLAEIDAKDPERRRSALAQQR